MCGIISVVRGPGTRQVLDPDQLVAPLEAALAALGEGASVADQCSQAATHVELVDTQLRTSDGVATLIHGRPLLAQIEGLVAVLGEGLAEIEAQLDAGAGLDDPQGEIERTNAAVVRLKDAVWAIAEDRIHTARAVADLAGSEPGWSALEGYASIQQALAAIDRLEVRGRDSAGIHVLVRDHGLDLSNPGVSRLLADRTDDPLFRSGAVRTLDGHLAFVYKAAAEIGELGDNTRVLRQAIRSDELLRLALNGEQAVATVLGHTRWASVGIISQANAHPVDSCEESRPGAPFVVAALNGDVDNFADLKAAEGLDITPEIGTDAKVIPTLVAHQLTAGDDLTNAFRNSVARFEGSVAIGACASVRPEQVLLALRGSGQALYVGLAEGAYVVASEPYGVVELTDRYLRLDGETPANPHNPSASRGQIVVLDGNRAGTVEGIERRSYDGTPLPVGEDDLISAQMTTRDIDRGEAPHFLLKEISEAPASFRKTLRGKLLETTDGDQLTVALGTDVLPDDVRAGLRSGAITRVVAIGQGTAAVAGRGVVAALDLFCDHTALRSEAMLATELSGFGLRPSMDDTLVVAVSQSGTTTDTNRTVDLVRTRGAKVVAIVNRRQSDLTDKADGVLYTSDGRDVEMSVASTKAFYSQIAAGFLLAAAIADEVGGTVDQAVLRSLRDLPQAMAAVLERRGAIAEAAHQLAPSRRYWAVVGNGVNRIAAAEVRIKLSELCYKSIASDSTEDKKHIDLSAEPLILVCAAGLEGSNGDDVAKEVAIYRAHKAAPVVVATEGQSRFGAALHVLAVPATHPALAFVLSTMAGHLFGYEAALAIDALARPLRLARGAIEAVSTEAASADRVAPVGEALLRRLRFDLEPLARQYFESLRVGSYNGHLEASSAVRLAGLLRYATGVVPLESYQIDEGKVGTPGVVIDDLATALTQAIEELTRPIDAIKHQAKTVTVGISRSDESLLTVPLVAEVVAAGTARDQLTYGVLRTLADISPAVAEVRGFTRYRIEHGPGAAGSATITVVDRGGIARDIESRTDRSPELRGTKHRVANEREVLVARGRSDGRPIVLVPEVKDGQAVGLTLLHVRFADHLAIDTARGVLQGYRNRYGVLRDAVRETEPTFREDLLPEIPVAELLTEPINQLADRWRAV